MSDRILKSGRGWRLGWNPTATEYQGLVGSEHWALELTLAEFKDFCRLLLQLAETMQQMSTELMDEEHIACELESPLLWLEASGYSHAYSIRLILQQGRRCEGSWPSIVVLDLLHAVQTITCF
jgi:hypothetical protein